MKVPGFQTVRPFIRLYIILFLVFNILLIAVYSFQSPAVEKNVAQSIKILDKGKPYMNIFQGLSENVYKTGAFSFTFIDNTMVRTLIPGNKELNPWSAALDGNNYARYWHGYTVVLKPLMIFFNYSQLRLMNIFLITCCTLITAILLAKIINIQTSFAFLLSLICVKIFIVPFCLAYSNTFYLFFVFLFILFAVGRLRKEPLGNTKFFSYFIFIVGSVTSYMDLLTTPIIPVGLLITIVCIWDYEKYALLLTPSKTIRLFCIWAAGYVGLWISKWILATVVLGKNVIYTGIKNVLFRIHADAPGHKIDSFTALKNVLLGVISPLDTFWIIVIVLLFALVVFILVRKGVISINKNFCEHYKMYFSLLVIGCVPFLWTLVIANHTQIHSWFTYRIYSVPLFIVLYIALKTITIPSGIFCRKGEPLENGE